MSTRPRGIERRRLKRVVKRIPVKFDAAGVQGTGHVKNMCKEGLFVRTNVLPEPGTDVQIIILTRDRRKIEVAGTVRWTTAQLGETPSQPGFGVQVGARTEEWNDFFEDLLLN